MVHASLFLGYFGKTIIQGADAIPPTPFLELIDAEVTDLLTLIIKCKVYCLESK